MAQGTAVTIGAESGMFSLWRCLVHGQSHACVHVTSENLGGGTSGFMMRLHFRVSLRILFRTARLLNLDCATCPSKFRIASRTKCWCCIDLLKHWKEPAGYENRIYFFYSFRPRVLAEFLLVRIFRRVRGKCPSHCVERVVSACEEEYAHLRWFEED